jgi:perosamine synthetase
MLVTDDEALAERMRKFGGLGFKNIRASTGQVRKSKDVFQDPAYLRHDSLGYNYRMPEVAAAVGLGQLEQLDLLVAKRVAMATKYRGALAGCEWLVPQFVPSGFTPSYYTFAALFRGEEKRGVGWRDFRRKFIENGGDGIYAAWALVYNEPVFQGIVAHCPNAEALQPRLMQFTTNQATDEEMDLQMNALARTIRHYD